MKNPFRTAEPLSKDLVAALETLERIGRTRPELAEPARTLAIVLKLAFSGAKSAGATSSKDAYPLAWAEGRPAFQVFPPTLDSTEISDRAVSIVSALWPANPTASRCLSALERGEIDVAACAFRMLRGEFAVDAVGLEELGIEAEFFRSVLRFGLLPSLAEITKTSTAPTEWPSASCPYCGSQAALAESRGLETSRFLRCGLCAGDWPAPRLGCPECGERDSDRCRILFVEGEENARRLVLCESCGLRLKVVSTLRPLSPPSIAVVELEAIHLDFL